MHASNLPAAEPQFSRRPSCAPPSPRSPEPTVDARLEAAVAEAAALRDAAAEVRAKEREAAAVVAAAAAARAAERAEKRKAHEGEQALKKVVEQIGARVGLLGSVGALFRRTDRCPAVIKVADITKAFEPHHSGVHCFLIETYNISDLVSVFQLSFYRHRIPV